MKTALLAVALFLGCTALAFPQARLAILPFTGGIGGDGEAVATMLAARQELRAAFTLVPLSGETGAEHLSAFTDSDIVADIGRSLNADYVLSGHIRRLGNRNLIIATVVCVQTLQLVAGYYRIYRNFRDLPGFLPSMSRNLARETLGRPTPGLLPSLAVAPLTVADTLEQLEAATVHGEADMHNLETLAQILAIRLAGTGKYAVLPRASVMRTALRAWETRAVDERAVALERLVELLLGILDEAEAVDETDMGAIATVGQAAGADLVLFVEMRDLYGMTVFVAQIRGGEPLDGVSRGYRNIGEGVNLMAELAFLLADPDGAPDRIATLNRQRRLANMFDDPARFWSLGVSAGTAFADPWAIGTLHATLAPLPFSFVRLGLDAGFVSEIEGASLFSIYPFAQYALFLPFARGGLYLAAGGGFLVARYTFGNLVDTRSGFSANFTAGINIGDVFEVSYTMRTDFSLFSGKVSAGFTHRFRLRGR